MQRVSVPQRDGLAQVAQAHGYSIGPDGFIPFWNERAYYRFTLAQIEEDLEAPTGEIQAMCFELLDRALADETVFHRLRIPEYYWDYAAQSWTDREKDLCGRLDLSYDGEGPAKLLEYNADTPTTLYEAAIFQWVWLGQAIEQGLVPEAGDQFTELHDDLVHALAGLEIDGSLHLACTPDIEDDRETVAYLEDCAEEAGLKPLFIGLKDIGIDAKGHFTDLEDRIITTMFKLYPWEWMMDEAFGAHMPDSGTRFIEPPWKGVLSNKGLLPILWEMFEGHPNLLPAYFEGDPRAGALGDSYVRKPLFSRQGWDVEIIDGGRRISRNRDLYGEEGYVVQALKPLPNFGGNFAVVGSWLVAGRAAGIGIREDVGPVTSEDAEFVPHVILD